MMQGRSELRGDTLMVRIEPESSALKVARLRARRIAEGRCIDCGRKPKVKSDARRCNRHAGRHRRLMRESKRRRSESVQSTT